MTVLFGSEVHVHYGSIWVDSGVGGWDEQVNQRAGQRNGLLGAAQPGFLQISTGMHTGLVPLRVEAHRSAPPIDDTYDEIVEASCDLRGPDVTLYAYTWDTALTLPQGGPHRVRLSARDYGAGREQDRYDPQDPVRDSYLLQLWPAPMAPDEVVKVTSPDAAYWHDEALSHPHAALSPHELALAEQRAEQRARDDAMARQRASERAWHLHTWGGRDPSPRLLEVEEHARALSSGRRDLVDALAALPPERQRALALDLARRACAAVDGPLDWQPALDALATGHPLPSPFDDEHAVLALLYGGPATVTATVTDLSGTEPPPRELAPPGVTAAFAVRAAAAPDPLEAALRAVTAGSWSAPDEDAYFADVADAIAPG